MVTGKGFSLDAFHKSKSIVWRFPVSSGRHNKDDWGGLLLQFVLEPDI